MDPYPADEPGFWRPSTIAAGIVLLLVLIAGVVLLVVRTGGGGSGRLPSVAEPGPVSSPSVTSSTSSPTTAVATRTGCSLPAGSQAVPQMTPQGITWQLYRTVALPYSPTAGPEVLDGDVVRCYAHDPLGALIAVTQISARIELAPDVRPAEQQLVANVGQRTFVEQQQRALQSGNGFQPGSYAQVAGFKFVTYSPAAAVIEVVTKTPEGALQASTLTADWIDGDWKLELQPTGDATPNVLPLTSLVGYATWAGV